tara:strand:+ start:161 stop:859 length:699 start_codon:yes stop_codon:yes gene_type:complete
MVVDISNLQPEDNKLLNSILSDLPSVIPVDAPIGQWHLDWFLWFIDTGIPYVVQINEANPLESLDWIRLGFPLKVQDAWNWLVNEFGYQWDINTLNWILANWGSGGFVGENIPTDSGVFVSDDGQTGNEALASTIINSGVLSSISNLYPNEITDDNKDINWKGEYKKYEDILSGSGLFTSKKKIYKKNDVVSKNNRLYIAVRETSGIYPEKLNSGFEFFADYDLFKLDGGTF